MPVATPAAQFQIWTDGSVRPRNPGYGGSAYLIIGEQVWVGCRWLGPRITNNQAELQAIYDAMDRLLRLVGGSGTPAVLHSDSEWAVNSITGVYKSTANREYLDKIATLKEKLPLLSFEWCRGHAGDPYNEFVDKMAKVATLIPKHVVAQTFTREQFTEQGRQFLKDQELLMKIN